MNVIPRSYNDYVTGLAEIHSPVFTSSSIYFLLYHRYCELCGWAILIVQLLFPLWSLKQTHNHLHSQQISLNLHFILAQGARVTKFPLAKSELGNLCKSY